MCAAWGEVFTDSGGHLQYFGDLVIFNPYDPGSAAIYNVEPSFVGTIGVIHVCVGYRMHRLGPLRRLHGRDGAAGTTAYPLACSRT